MSSLDDRIEALLTGRDVEVFLALATERRLRAQIHRMNAQTVTASSDEDDLFDPDDDVVHCLMAMVELGLETSERQDGVEYDEKHWTSDR